MRDTFKALAAILLLTATAFSSQSAVPAHRPSSGVPDSHFRHLRHGINLSHWFAQSRTGSYDVQYLTTFTTTRDFDLIRSMGFDHVRLTLEPSQLFTPSQPDKLEPEHLNLLDNAVQMALARDLAIIIDIHSPGDFTRALASNQHNVEGFVDFWRALAKHFAGTDAERVFFEVLNEPEMSDGYRWYGIETQIIAAIRSSAPQHTIIVTGHGWSAVDDLVALEPFADPNLIYNFHFYEPTTFTHQGATWGLELWHHLRHVHYPSRPGANKETVNELPQFPQKLQLLRYDQDRWDRERIDAEISLVAAWAAIHNVRVTCNEFGVYRKYADPDERAAWIRDVRTSLEAHGIGWTMWDYAGDFAVAPGEPGQRVPDDRVLKALGLK